MRICTNSSKSRLPALSNHINPCRVIEQLDKEYTLKLLEFHDQKSMFVLPAPQQKALKDQLLLVEASSTLRHQTKRCCSPFAECSSDGTSMSGNQVHLFAASFSPPQKIQSRRAGRQGGILPGFADLLLDRHTEALPLLAHQLLQVFHGHFLIQMHRQQARQSASGQ